MRTEDGIDPCVHLVHGLGEGWCSGEEGRGEGESFEHFDFRVLREAMIRHP
ncbi:MAG: hypothetical protein ABIY37_11075 [Devosia sp.]